MSRRPRLPALLAAVAVLGFAGCSTTTEEPFVSNPVIEGSGDDGGSTAVTSPPDAACDDADPAASLDPGGTLDELSAQPAPRGSTLAAIRQRGTLVAGVGADTLLFGYLNPDSAQLEGFDVEIAELVGDAILGGQGRVELVPIQSPDRIARLQDGGVDIVVKTMTITCQRWAEIDFSSVYYQSGQKLLVGTDSPVAGVDDLGEDSAICAVSDTTSLARLQEAGVGTVEASSWTECLVKFQRSEADGVSTDDTILAGLVDQDPYAQVVGPAFSSEPYGIGLPPDSPELTRLVNAVLAQITTDGSWQRLYDEWLSETLGSAAPPTSPTYRP
jgi:polar amino acid transport system substrate-binding protein